MLSNCLLSLFLGLFFQTSALNPEKPKLVVGVVVDQMRHEYLDRYWDLYRENGFKRLVCEGFSFNNAHINYLPTSTAAGHASIFTGTGPMNHGIIGNKWFDREKGKSVSCVADDTVSPVGTQSRDGQKSPQNLKSSTIGDENRLSTQMRGKTIGIALKDRASVFSAGHNANAAYWFYGADEGKFISSSWYMEALPDWVDRFNASGIAESYLTTWNTIYPQEHYTASGKDLSPYEEGFTGKESTAFPYDLKELSKENGKFDIIEDTPFGNDLTLDFALAAISAEELGKDAHTDFLTISFSSTDKVGHKFGVNSQEVQDAFIRLDRNLAALLDYLDSEVGKGEYLLFLTADHGSTSVPAYLQTLKMEAGYFDLSAFRNRLKQHVKNRYGENLIKKVSRNQIYLDYQALNELNLGLMEVENFVALFVMQQYQVNRVYTRSQLAGLQNTDERTTPFKNGFNSARSGDIFFLLDPGVIASSDKKGSAHSSGYTHDSHIPLIFFGKNVKQGMSYKRTRNIDIAPTISSLLGIPFPNAATGNPLCEILQASH